MVPSRIVMAAYLMAFFALVGCHNVYNTERQEQDFNFGWKFHLNDISEASSFEFNDSEWRDIRLPHDWSVEHSFTQENAAGATAFLPGGIGWYRKTFEMPKSAADKVTWIEFDGVYTNSEVWINGHYLGKRPFGYAPYSYDLSEHLNYDGSNVIAVKADRSAYIDSRWYPGSGIYRNVKLVTASKTHIPQWGVFVTTPEITENQAVVNVSTELNIDPEFTNELVLRVTITDDNEVVSQVSKAINASEASSKSVAIQLEIEDPKRWDINTPHMYVASTEVLVNGRVIDNVDTKFGVRDFYFDVEKGFFLNGKNTLLKGVCLHHDGGLVGAAVPKGVWERRLQLLKDAGCNAIRTAHNPPSDEFLDLCDEMGFLVQDEAFDEFQNPKDKRKNYNQKVVDDVTRGYAPEFDNWAERDLKAMVKRDRNHPSIIMWSIGNEIEWTFPEYGNATGYWGSNKVDDVNYYWDEPPFTPEQIKDNFYAQDKQDVCAETAKKLSAWVKEIDTTRPVTANLVIPSVSMFSGYADALDIVGLSYRQAVYDYCRTHYPDKVILGTENWTRYSEWKPVVDNEYMSGIFMWTGISYMGESRSWPIRGSGSGLLDFAGFKKPSYYFFSTLWNDTPQVYLTTQVIGESPYKVEATRVIEKEENWAARQKWGWQKVNNHWNYAAGDSIIVEVYTNQPTVELLLNGESLGTRSLKDVDDHILKWMVPFAEGELKAVAVDADCSSSIKTVGEAHSLKVTVDNTQITSDEYDVAHITVQLLDKAGLPVRNVEKEISFEIDGPLKVLGVDNGSASSVQDYQSTTVITANGKCLLIVQSLNKEGLATITASAKGLSSETVNIEIQ